MISQKSITLRHLLLDGQPCIALHFAQDEGILSCLNTFPEIAFSESEGVYYLPNKKMHLDRLYDRFRGQVWINGNHFYDKSRATANRDSPNMQYFRTRRLLPGRRACPEEYILKLELKRYAFNTAKTYIQCFEKFMNAHPDCELMSISEIQIRQYLQHLNQTGCSDSYLNQMLNSIKFYYEKVKGMPNRFYSIERPRKKEVLPRVIGLEEVRAMIELAGNIKHRCIISLLYSAGLRRSELLNLQLTDIDSKRMVILIRAAKGGKDRLTLLSPSVLRDLRQYYVHWKPETYLFEGRTGVKYSATSVIKIVKRAARRAGIRKRVSPHTLRHSFATHLLEQGTDLRYIQALLGHNSSKTTERYTRVATNQIQNIKSPIESFNLGT